MAASVRAAVLTTPDNSLPTRCQGMAKADLPGDNGLQETTSHLSGVLKDTCREHFGKQGAAAAVAGQAESNFSRDLDAIARKLAPLGDALLGRLGEKLTNQFGPLTSPKARARQSLRVARAALDEFEQYVEEAL